jgi:diguanylate cyclase (GGDEF)-like protein
MQPERASGTVLLVDDNITNLKVATEHLKAAHYEILTAKDGESAIVRAQLAQPDLILLDVQMNGIDGFETCRRLKANELTKNIPVIFMTVLISVEDKLKGFAAGAVDYVPKPFQFEELLARVNTHVTIYRLQRELEAEIRERRLVEKALRKASLELRRLAVLDDLTQIANRRRFDQYLQSQLEQPTALTCSLLLCDVDFFKRYNDNYGHQAGDRCLKLVAQGISRAVGYAKDLVARYGGEEFAIILPETDSKGALRVAEVVQNEIRSLKIPHEFSEVNEFITLSIGVATTMTASTTSPPVLIAVADSALYEAKSVGRNRVINRLL